MFTPTPEKKDELKNYDMLKILGRDKKGIKVIKVRSINDNKIYCLRKIKKGNYLDNDIKALKEFLTKINHPHIIKYYDIFEEKENLYFVMEYIETDIKDYIEKYSIIKKKVPEENILFLLLQCLSALNYIHSKMKKDRIKEFGITLSNILMPTERGIKIALIKDEIPSELKEKDDIQLLYKYFELIMFPERFKHGKGINEYLSDPLNNDYDKELRSIIYYMDTDFNKIENYFINKYNTGENKNTSIKSVFECLSKCEKLKESFTQQSDEKNEYLFNICKALFNKQEDKYSSSMEKLKGLLALEYSTLDDSQEINPIFVINLFLKCKKDISDLFSVKKKIIKTCQTCGAEIVSDKIETSIIFDITKMRNKIFNLSIDGFGKYNQNQNKEIEFYCDKCYSKMKFDETYEFSNYLIIYFDRGHTLTDKTKIAFSSKIEIEINSNDKVKFNFIGCIINQDNYIFENIKDLKSITKNNLNLLENNKLQDKIIILIYQKV